MKQVALIVAVICSSPSVADAQWRAAQSITTQSPKRHQRITPPLSIASPVGPCCRQLHSFHSPAVPNLGQSIVSEKPQPSLPQAPAEVIPSKDLGSRKEIAQPSSTRDNAPLSVLLHDPPAPVVVNTIQLKAVDHVPRSVVAEAEPIDFAEANSEYASEAKREEETVRQEVVRSATVDTEEVDAGLELDTEIAQPKPTVAGSLEEVANQATQEVPRELSITDVPQERTKGLALEAPDWQTFESETNLDLPNEPADISQAVMENYGITESTVPGPIEFENTERIDSELALGDAHLWETAKEVAEVFYPFLDAPQTETIAETQLPAHAPALEALGTRNVSATPALESIVNVTEKAPDVLLPSDPNAGVATPRWFFAKPARKAWMLPLMMPLLLLPVLGWFLWRVFAGKKKRNTELNEQAIVSNAKIDNANHMVNVPTVELESKTRSLTNVATLSDPVVAAGKIIERQTEQMPSPVAAEQGDATVVSKSTDDIVKPIANTVKLSATAEAAPSVENETATSVVADTKEVLASQKKPSVRRSDDLTRIRGVDLDTQNALNRAGYWQFTDLEAADPKQLQQDLAAVNYKGRSDCGNWIQLASTHCQADKADCITANQSVGTDTQTGQRDFLSRINGIGPATAKVLNDGGINSFDQLRTAQPSYLAQLLENAGDRFRLIDPTTWSRQAEFAATDDWDGLDNWNAQNDSTESRRSQISKVNSAQLGFAELGNQRGEQRQSDSTISPTRSRSEDASIKNDQRHDLTRINGIGPATAKVLNDAGINSFQQLCSAEQSYLSQVLEKAGARFRLIDPTTWSRQAEFAATDDWDALNKWNAQNESTESKQDRTGSANATPANFKASEETKDDLTEVVGIGRATQRHLNSNGIYRFEQIALMTSDQLKALFEDAQAKFKLVDPGTWPKQAAEIVSRRPGFETEGEVLKEISEIASGLGVQENTQERLTKSQS